MSVIIKAQPYAPGPIQPFVLTGENVGVWSQGSWSFFKALHVEPIPPSPQTIQDLGAIAAAGSTNPTQLTTPRAQDGNLVHLRMKILDDIEADIAEQLSTARHTLFSVRSRITPWMSNLDPYNSLATYWVLGNQKTMYATAYNNSGYAVTQSRFLFWGYRYVLDPLSSLVTTAFRKVLVGASLEEAENTAIKNMQVTIVPAEGREA